MKSIKYSDCILTVIAALLAVVAWQQHTQRPITQQELVELAKAGDPDRYYARQMQMPYVEVRTIRESVDVSVNGSVTVEAVVEPVQVHVLR